MFARPRVAGNLAGKQYRGRAAAAAVDLRMSPVRPGFDSRWERMFYRAF